MRCFIIAEAGVNHNGDMKIARRLVDAAVDAGVDAVKFQTFVAEKLSSRHAARMSYQTGNTGDDGGQLEMLKKLELSARHHTELFAHCKQKGILFLSTPFDESSVDMLFDLGMEIFKVPSGEITNKGLIEHIAAKRRPVILSTGMSYMGEVEKAIGWIDEVWRKADERPDLTLLHCISSYPAPAEEANLSAIGTLKNAFGLPVGYSDHTLGIEVAVAAVAIGACVIEKHFTLDRSMEGPDHRASIEPHELSAMVKAIRNVERAIGDGIKRPAASELDTREVARRSLVAARGLRAGERISAADITVKRPGTGIAPEHMDEITGMRITHDIEADSVIGWKDLEKDT